MKLSLRQKHRIEWGAIALSCIVFVVGALADSQLCQEVGFVGILVSLVVGELVWWRCPHCGSYLNRVAPPRDNFCPRCGEKIDWDEKQS